MHSDDFDRITIALGKAGVVDPGQAHRAAIYYRASREEIEREADERAGKLLGRKPFDKLLLLSDPVFGVPVVFWAIIAWIVLASILK